MKKVARSLGIIFLFYVSAALEASVSTQAAILGVGPNFLLVVALTCALYLAPATAAAYGFAAGMLLGLISGANLFSYVLSTVIAAYSLAAFQRLEFQVNSVLAAGLVGAGTLIAQLIFMIFAPPSELLVFLGVTLGMAVYNAVLALPLYGLLKPLMNPRKGFEDL